MRPFKQGVKATFMLKIEGHQRSERLRPTTAAAAASALHTVTVRVYWQSAAPLPKSELVELAAQAR